MQQKRNSINSPPFSGYVIVLAALAVMAIVWGTNYSFGVFFTPILREFGYAGGSVVMPTIVAEIFGLGAHGGILGIVNFSACCGVAVGPMMVGWLFDQSGDYQVAFRLMVAFSILSLLMALGLRTGSQHTSEERSRTKSIFSK